MTDRTNVGATSGDAELNDLRSAARTGLAHTAKDTGETEIAAAKVVAASLEKSIIKYAGDRDGVKTTGDVDTLFDGVSPASATEAKDLFAQAIRRQALEKIGRNDLEPEQLGDTIGDTGVTVTDEFRALAGLEDANDALRRVYDTESLEKVRQDLAGNSSATVQNILQADADYLTAKDASNKYSFGGITKQEAEARIGSITDASLAGAARKYTAAVDKHDYNAQSVSELALYDFKSKLDARRLHEVTEPLNSQRQAAFPDDMKAVDSISAKAANIIKAYDNELATKVKAANASLTPDVLPGMPALEDGYKSIDLTDVSSDKKLFIKEDGEQRTYDQIAEVYNDGGEAVLHFQPSATVSEAAKAEMQRIYRDIQPLAEAAMQHGAVYTIRLGVDTTNAHASDYHAADSYSRMDRTVYILMPRNASTSVDALRQLWTHELVHALMEDTYNNVGTTPKDTENMRAACSALSEQALGLFTSSMQASLEKLDRLAATLELSPEEQKVFVALKDMITKGEVKAPTASSDKFLSACTTPSFDRMLSDAVSRVA